MTEQDLPEIESPLSTIEYMQASLQTWRAFGERSAKFWSERLTNANLAVSDSAGTSEADRAVGEIMRSISDLNMGHWQNTARYLDSRPKVPEIMTGAALTDWFDSVRRSGGLFKSAKKPASPVKPTAKTAEKAPKTAAKRAAKKTAAKPVTKAKAPAAKAKAKPAPAKKAAAKPTAAAAKPAPAKKAPAKPAAKKTAAPKKAAAPKAAKVKTGPLLLKKPEGTPDDLTRIKGIGPKIADKLNEIGVYHFRQIAKWSNDDAIWFDETVSSRGSIQRQDWIKQARSFSANGSAHA